MAPIPNADYSDMQGLLRFGYGKLTAACFLLLRIDDAVAAAGWLAQAPVSTAEVQSPPPERALQLAFTEQGLRKLALNGTILDGFSAEFLSGMCGEENRSRRLGDVGANSPDGWLWGSPDSVPDMMAMIYATPDGFDEWRGALEAELRGSGFTLLQCLPTSDMGGVEPFGFTDGVSTPVIDWERRRNPSGDKLAYENIVMLGEFVLGYPNEYGKFTGRPVVDDTGADLPDAEDVAGSKDLGRNGSYLVMRHIEQDVRGFWSFIDQQAGGDSAQSQELAERLVGRRMSGDPIVPLSREKIPGVGDDAEDARRNQFTFAEDAQGIACPFGAHIRRANPRNADLPPGTPAGLLGKLSRTLALERVFGDGGDDAHRDRVDSTRFHRLLRRGREYGPKLTAAERLQPALPRGSPSGLYFICLNGNIGRQFEFVQSAWIQSTKFDGLTGEGDPLLGNREPVVGCAANRISIPVADGLRRQLQDVPRFTTVRGGAYFFLPGIRALRYMARAAKA